MDDTADFCCISESLKVSNIVQKTVLRIYEGECVGPSFLCKYFYLNSNYRILIELYIDEIKSINNDLLIL